MSDAADVSTRALVEPAVFALWEQAESRRLGGELREAGIPVLLLKGPDLQQRLYGTPAAYPSSDVDVLVPRSAAGFVRRQLKTRGWRFEPGNGVLWHLSAAATFERDLFRADVHWGLHAAHLPARSLRPLEDALWRSARPGLSGFLEPDPEALLVFLAVHVVGHRFERPEWQENVRRASEQIGDWNKVWRIARRARVRSAVLAALRPQQDGTRLPVLDGMRGRAVWYASYMLRGHPLPQQLRDRVRETLALHREGFGWRAGRRDTSVDFRDMTIAVSPGVFDPQPVTAGVVDLAIRLGLRPDPRVVVDVGTGTGAVSLLAARQWPGATVIGVDISARAVACARRNAARLGTPNVRFLRGSLLAPLPDYIQGRVDVIMSNVPYVSYVSVKSGWDRDAWAIPDHSLFGPDADGLGFMRSLSRDVPRFLRPGGCWVFQIGDSQWDLFADHLLEAGFEPIAPERRRRGKAIIAAARWG